MGDARPSAEKGPRSADGERRRPRIDPALVVLCLVVQLGQLVLSEPVAGQSMPEADGYRWIRPAVVNLRAGAGTRFEKIGRLRRGDRVWLVYVDEGWAEIQIPKDDGWQRGFVRFDLLVDSDPTLEVASEPSRSIEPAERRDRVDRDGIVLRVLLLAALFLVIAIGIRMRRRRRTRPTAFRSPFQNRGEATLTHLLESHFQPPDYHLMNHITLRVGTGTTQIDHVLVSRYGVFVIETKDYKGWIFGSPNDPQWTQVLHRRKFRFQNPIVQNRRHVKAVEDVLDFLSPDSVISVVAFVGDAEFKTPMPECVLQSWEVVKFVRRHAWQIMSRDQLQLCVGRLETARLAVTGETDLEHIRNVERWHGRRG